MKNHEAKPKQWTIAEIEYLEAQLETSRESAQDFAKQRDRYANWAIQLSEYIRGGKHYPHEAMKAIALGQGRGGWEHPIR